MVRRWSNSNIYFLNPQKESTLLFLRYQESKVLTAVTLKWYDVPVTITGNFFLFLLFGIILYGTYSAEKEQCFLWLFFSCSLINHHVVVGINIQIYEITRFLEVSKNQIYKKRRFLILFVFWIGQLRTRKKKERIFYFELITVYPPGG